MGSVVAVIADALARGVTSPGPVNLAFGGRASLLDLIAELSAVLGRDLPLAFGPARAGDVHDSQAYQTRLRALFPAIEPVSLTDGLRATAQWFGSETTPVS